MDMNMVVLSGKLAAPPELRKFDSGSRLLRSLVTARCDTPRRRVDVIPVTLWDPAQDHEIIGAPPGQKVWVLGTVQRRFWSSTDGRRSRLEVVAYHMQRAEAGATAATGTGDDALGEGIRRVE